MTDNPKYITIRDIKDQKLLFIGKLLEIAPISYNNDQNQWLLSGYFHFPNNNWQLLTRNILQPQEELFTCTYLTEQEHFLLLLREKLQVEEIKEEEI